MKTSKNTWAHAKMTSYLYMIVKTYPVESCLSKNQQVIEAWMQQALADANPEARQFARRTFLLWQKLSPQDADDMFVILDYAIQKAILDERDISESD